MTELKYSAEYFGATNQGMVRTNNEDTYICQKIWDESHILCAAIDGLGGYEGGEIAADLAWSTIIKHLEDFASKKIGELLKASLIAANNEIIRQHEARPRVSQMGCVASVGVIDLSQGVISIAHVGDSRIYQFVNGGLKKLTHDHSLVGYREETGELSEEDAMNHPKRNVIDKFLGEQHLNYDSDSYIEVSVWPITGDTQYLFCSDGLTDLVTSTQISKILSSEYSIKEKVEALISSANEAGGKDNITVVLTDIKVLEDSKHIMSSEEDDKVSVSSNNKSKSCCKTFFIGCIVGLVIGAVSMYICTKINNNYPVSEIHTEPGIYGSLQDRIRILEDSVAKLSGINIHSTVEHIDTTDSSN